MMLLYDAGLTASAYDSKGSKGSKGSAAAPAARAAKSSLGLGSPKSSKAVAAATEELLDELAFDEDLRSYDEGEPYLEEGALLQVQNLQSFCSCCCCLLPYLAAVTVLSSFGFGLKQSN